MTTTPEHGALRDRWTLVDGVLIYARETVPRPARDAAPLVAVPGLNVSSRHMIRLMELLAPHLRVYSPDLPGYGQSDKPWRLATLPEQADTVVRWMTAAGIERAALLGSSYSAQIVADAAARYPARVTRAILASPTVDPSARPLPKLIYRWRVNEHREPSFVGQVTKRDYRDVSRLRVVFTLWQMVRDHIEEKLPLVRQPALVVRGGDDPIVTQRWAEEATRLLPCGRLVVIPGGKHALNLDQPERLARVVRAFLAGDAGDADTGTDAATQERRTS